MDTAELSISIDLKKNRIRIHKTTLRQLGSPVRVQLLFNPGRRELLISCPTKTIPESQDEKVIFDKPAAEGGTCQLYSRELIKRIQAVCPELENNELYQIGGRYLPGMNAALFRMDRCVRSRKTGEEDND